MRDEAPPLLVVGLLMFALAFVLLSWAANSHAQFQIPGPAPGATDKQAGPDNTAGDGDVTSRHIAPEATGQFPQRLKLQYGWGSESEINYRRDRDLDRSVRDNALLLRPQVSGIIVYRPADWLTTTLEMIFEREIAAKEEAIVALPNGSTQSPPRRDASLIVDQAYLTVRGVTAPFEFHLGRRNYEDERHWLYDTSLDIASVAYRQGPFRAEFLFGREVWQNLDLISRQARDRVDTQMLYADYRGIDDYRFAAYTIEREDRSGQDGHARLTGVRMQRQPAPALSYWAELAWLTGTDANRRKFTGHGYDVGATYRFEKLPFYPNVTLGYAFGSGDDNPGDEVNREFRQSGLASNETRFAGIPKFKIYGEAVDPELSNLKILTAAFGFRPTPRSSVDIVFHKYRLDHVADELRSSNITAIMNQAGQSKDVGRALDLVVGFRNVFGVRRLGIDLRAGWFYPGAAFRRNVGDEDNPSVREADRSIGCVIKFWY